MRICSTREYCYTRRWPAQFVILARWTAKHCLVLVGVCSLKRVRIVDLLEGKSALTLAIVLAILGVVALVLIMSQTA